MSTFTLHTTETAPAASKEQLTGIEKAWSFVPNLHRTLAESPVTLEAYNTLFGLFGKSSFTPAEQQVVYLAINVVNECEYCTSGHSVLAKHAGGAPVVVNDRRKRACSLRLVQHAVKDDLPTGKRNDICRGHNQRRQQQRKDDQETAFSQWLMHRPQCKGADTEIMTGRAVAVNHQRIGRVIGVGRK